MHAIEPCPRISSGVGRVVTGTFTHVRGGILRIRLFGLAEPLGVTSNHSIYSADRLDFVRAGELRVGETLRNLDGDVRIESIEQLGREERVYNLEIHGEHVFRVASSGVLVHNSSGAEGSSKPVTRFATGPNGVVKDLGPTLDRIRNGVRFPHRNDGSIFQNREGLLPTKPAGYWKEYVHPTPGGRGPGAQRIVIGQNGEMFFTPNHYRIFIPLNP